MQGVEGRGHAINIGVSRWQEEQVSTGGVLNA
jgi:hypothetical protein